MKKATLPILLLAALLSNNAQAQNKAYAITGESKGTYTWTAIREIDLSNGNVVKTIYSANSAQKVNYNFLNSVNRSNLPQQASSPTANGVAATAYDAKNNRLYFSQMWSNDLRFVDLNSNEMTVVVNNDEKYSTGPRVDESNVITRMAFGADGNGYALTNDGNQLIQFTTDNNPVITKLGALIDSKKNNGISVHNQCTSWGGDLIADAFGNLYLFTYRNHIFKINVATRVAEHIGTVKNLPANFTTNGAAVDENGEVFVTSATQTENYYRINLSTLEAKPVDKTEATVYNASDLANGNLAYKNTKSNPVLADIKLSNAISIYPNPAINKAFAVQFDKLPAGNYSIELTDANGKRIFTKTLGINGLQNEKINLPKAAATGLYFLKVTNSTGKSVYYDKLIVQ
ncbi:MAG: T9SS type A sorting domain-containing protein [Chitinophagaceae bacterium]|jgi:hypothetical protein|nr:T9SS type A sorting domain-containing protein [Chitinophagaceae bacterium]